MKKIIFSLILVFIFSITSFSQSTTITSYTEGRGLTEYQDLMVNTSVGDDSTTIVAGDTIWSDIVYIGNYVGGEGAGRAIIQYIIYSPANDSVCYRAG